MYFGIRHLTALAFASLVLAVSAAESISKVSLEAYRSAEPESEEWSDASSHLVVLGSLEKVNRELQPEKSEIFYGRRYQETYYLPEARRTEQVFDHYRLQLEQLGEVLFQCDGRACGSSSYWANKVFEEAILYGPEQFQKYLIAKRSDGGGYVAVYVAQRASRKIYAHQVHFLPQD